MLNVTDYKTVSEPCQNQNTEILPLKYHGGNQKQIIRVTLFECMVSDKGSRLWGVVMDRPRGKQPACAECSRPHFVGEPTVISTS